MEILPLSEETNKPPTGFECRFAVHVDPPEHNEPDMHLVKLQTHNADGTITPEVKLVYNYKRPFWIAQKGARQYKQHKEWEDINKLIKYETTQSNLSRSIARAIGNPGFRGQLKQLYESPYIYGSEILSTALLKKTLSDRHPNLKTKYTVAVGDIETDVINGSEEIIMMSITFKSSVTIAVLKSYLQGEVMVEEKFDKAMKKYLSNAELLRPNPDNKKELIPTNVDILKERNIQYELKIVDTPLDIVKIIAAKANELKPDFFAFWNIDFDMSKILKTLDNYNIHPKDIFSDPIVPKSYRYFRYKKGAQQKVTASGKITPIKPAAQWHTVFSTSSFYFVDAMCVYKQVRTGKQEEQSYSLDAILKRNNLGGKLHFKEADHLTGLKWHQLMQSRFKIEYMVYNVWDCISVEMLDEKNGDMALTMPMFSDFSDFQHFNSQPRRLVDKLHYFCLEKGKVIGVTPPKGDGKDSDDVEDNGDEDNEDEEELEMTEANASKVSLDLKGWIITLPAHLIQDSGLKCIEEFPNLRSNCHVHTGDLDVSASYPNGGATLNMSKETTILEIGRVDGVDEYTQRMQGINLATAGHVNGVEYCQAMFNFPSMIDMLSEFNKENTVVSDQ